MLRAFLGACAGVLAAVGWHLTWRRSVSPWCVGDTDWGCGVERLMVSTTYAIGWAVAAALALFTVSALLKLPGAARAPLLGCLFWPVGAFGFGVLGAQLELLGLVVPVVVFTVAGVVSGRGSRSPQT